MVLLTDEQCKEGIQRICDMAFDIAKMSGLVLDRVIVDDDRHIECYNTFHILQFIAKGSAVSTKIHHEEVVEISNMTSTKIQSAIDRLRLMLVG
jgi:hypothetical protein